MEDKAGKTAKEYKKRGMGYVEPWVTTILGVVHRRFETWLSNLDHSLYVAKAIYATIGKCLLAQGPSDGQCTTTTRELKG